MRKAPGGMLGALAAGFTAGQLAAPVLPHPLRKLPRSQRVAVALESLPEQAATGDRGA